MMPPGGISQRLQTEDELRQRIDELDQRVEERAGMLRLLNDVATACHRAATVDDAVDFVLQRFSRYNGWCFGHAFRVRADDNSTLEPFNGFHENQHGRFERFRKLTERLCLECGQGLPGRVYQTREPEVTHDLDQDLVERRADVGESLGITSAIAFPVIVGDEVVMILEFFSDERIEKDDRILDGSESIGTQLAYVVERKRLERQLVDAVMSEQRTIAHELHDSVGQQLAALSVLTEKLERQLVAEKSPHADMAQNIVGGVRDALEGVRAASRGLVPVPVESGGLAMALRELAQSVDEQERIRCTVDSDGDFRFSDDLKATHMYRIAQEAVTNATRHSRGSSIVIRLQCPDHSVLLEVLDDGVGISDDVVEQDGGLGLQTMRHRASVIGAHLVVQRREEGGTVVRCVLPRNR